ncbi:MAG: N-acetylmuramoyl-L-alanine amidase, partial [Longimicrobiaceae bacterium]
ALRVVHPADGATVEARGATWLAGSLGNGRATLTVNGRPAEVRRNGSFLAWVPLPAGSTPAYRLVAALGGDTVRRLVPVHRRDPDALPGTGRLVVDTASLAPRERLRLRADERVRVGVRAPANARVWLLAGGERHPLSPNAPVAAPVEQGGGGPRVRRDPERWAVDLPAAALAGRAVLVAARGADTVRLALAPVEVVDPARPEWVVLGRSPGSAGHELVGSAEPDGEYRWFFLPGTRVRATGARGGRVRVRLDAGQEAWVSAEIATPLAAAPAAAALRAGAPALTSSTGYVELAIPLPAPPAYRVEQGERALSLTLYGVEPGGEAPPLRAGDGYARELETKRELRDRVRFTLRLAGAPYGYRAFWRDGAFVLRVRRPPAVQPRSPLGGLTLAVDAGHPPHGAVGPTGLREADVTLQVARRLARLLERRGAHVVLTRGGGEAVALEERTARALRADAHALVSIHADAVADGQDPARVNGTATYFFHPQSAPLAMAVQRRMVERMGRADRGARPKNLAIARATWMPAVLCEGAMIVHPDEEAALRTPVFQEAYARGIADGLEDYFRALGDGR